MLPLYNETPSDDRGIVLNAPYYIVLFASFLLLHLYHILIIPAGGLSAKVFFCVQAITEIFIEVLLLLILSIFLKKYLPRRVLSFAIGAIGIIFFIRVFDFPLIRLMDMSFWHAIDVISQERPQNLFEIALASGIPLWIYLLLFTFCLLVLWTAVKIYYYLDKKSLQFPLYISFRKAYGTLSACFVFLFFWDVALAKTFAKTIDCEQCALYAKALPWKDAFLQQKFSSVHFPLEIRKAPSGKKIQEFLNAPVQSENKPLIILCIAESIRADFLNAQNTPYLQTIKESSIPYNLALSGANATQLSWYTIFSGLTALHFENMHQDGVPLLQKMKKEGYKIHVATASRMRFYQMDEKIFGYQKKQADTFYEKTTHLAPYRNDQEVFQSVQEMLPDTLDTGHFFILFIESTHFPYSFDENQTPFAPFAKNINVVKEACYKPGPILIANRYRNALFHLDSQIGQLKKHLEEKGLWEKTLFIFTGDHGEEFFEKGNLFHASALSEEQTEVPLLIKPPSSMPMVSKPVAMLSHTDIPHAIFHAAFGADNYTIGEGVSPFSSTPRSFALVGRYNASKAPKEILIHNGYSRLIVQLDKPHQISIRKIEQENHQSSVFEQFGPAFDFIFSQEK